MNKILRKSSSHGIETGLLFLFNMVKFTMY